MVRDGAGYFVFQVPFQTELVLDALNMAIWQRRPREFVGHRRRELGVRPSMESVGD